MTEPLIRYDADPTGTNSNNLITDETHTLGNQTLRLLVPKYNPFFTKNLVITNTVNNNILTRGIHYQCVELVDDLTIQYGQEVAQVILIIDPTVSQTVKVNYQTVGGDHPNNAASLIELYNSVLTTDTFVPWTDVQNKPSAYPPSLHNHLAVDFYGYEHLVVVINRIKEALELSNIPSLDSTKNWLNSLLDAVQNSISQINTDLSADLEQAKVDLSSHTENFGNPHLTTKAQVGLSNISNYDIATQAEAEAGTTNIKYSTPARVKDTIDQFAGLDLISHTTDNRNPHTVTKAQVGLSNISNYPIASNLEAELAISNDRYMTPVKTVVELGALVDDSLLGHSTKTNNPHQVNKSHVGLSVVENYDIATKAEAEAGVVENKYMTPLRTKEAIDAASSGALSAHIGDVNNPHQVTKAQIGLGSVVDYAVATEAEALAGLVNNKYVTPYLVKLAFSQLQVQTVTWNSIADLPATFNPTVHTHSWNDVSDKPLLFAPASHTHDWSTIGNKLTEYTPASHVNVWDDISDKPTSFPPSTHSHTWGSILNKPSLFPPDAHNHAWSDLTGIPTEFPSVTHTHDISEVSGLSNTQSVNISGPSLLYPLVNYNYTITNFDSYTTYNISSLYGSVTRSDDTVTYTPHNSPGVGGFTINGRDIVATILAAAPNTPSITSPTNGAIDRDLSLTITSSAFSISTVSDSHFSSDWQLSTNSSFTAIVAQVVDSVVNKTSWPVSGLSNLQTYYVRVRHKGSNFGYSPWSNAISFTTKPPLLAGVETHALVPSGIEWESSMNAVDIDSSGNRFIAGARNHGLVNGGKDLGIAYIYSWNGSSWGIEATFMPVNPQPGSNDPEQFGASVAINAAGDIAVVGSPLTFNSAAGAWTGGGSIHTRSGTTWSKHSNFGNFANTSKEVGASVDLNASGDRIVIGAPGTQISAVNNVGRVHILYKAGASWTEEQFINGPVVINNAWFGCSVSIDDTGDRIVVGSKQHNTTYPGVAYVYKRTGTAWALEATLAASDGTALDWFGSTVKINSTGDRIAVSADGEELGGSTDAGAVYIFVRSGTTWTQEAKLTPNSPRTRGRFGMSLAFNSDATELLIGSPGDRMYTAQIGYTYSFKRTGTSWTQRMIITASVVENNGFGEGVAITPDSKKAVITASYSTSEIETSTISMNKLGTLYVFN